MNHNRPQLTCTLDNGIFISAVDHTTIYDGERYDVCETCVFFPDEWGMLSEVEGSYEDFANIAAHYNGMTLATYERYDQWAPYYAPKAAPQPEAAPWPAPDPATRQTHVLNVWL